jgi:hypothetical protein
MKIVNFLVLILIISGTCQAQAVKTFEAKLVKEKYAVDSMVSRFKYFNRESGFKNDSSMILAIWTAHGKGGLYSIHFVDSIKNSTIYTSEVDILKKGNLRYFNYENNFVLIYGDDDADGLFEPTDKSTRFTINLTIHNKIIIRKDDAYLYEYVNGKFRILGTTH